MARNSAKRLASYKRYREKHKEKRAAYAKEYYARRMQADPLYNHRKCKAYRDKHADKIKDYKKANRERERRVSAEWRKNNPEKWRIANNIRSKRFSQNNPERSRELKSVCTAKRRAAKGKLSRGIVIKLRISQNGLCVYCKNELTKFHLDHIMPISRGGKHEDGNMQLLCPSCNLRKSSRHPEDFAALFKRSA